jgi:hypothetical protein
MRKQMKWRCFGISVIMGLAFGGLAPAVSAPLAPAVQYASMVANVPGAVSPGAFCSTAGATGKTKAGTKMKCKTTAKDKRLRWRRA